jgi:thiamine-phosphate pyrophosphorylase
MATPVVCMITDRVRLAAPTLDTATDEAGRRTPGAAVERRVLQQDRLVARIAAAARAGVHLVQIRERDLDGRALFELVRACVDAVRATRTRVLVNDRVDVAVAAGAHGVHLRSDSLPAARARAITPPGFLIGRSVHDAGEARRVTADGAVDYVIFGPVFETASKPGKPAAGLAALSAAVAATSVPVLAVGGMSRDRIAAITATGAAGIAAIGLFADAADELSVFV